MRSGFLALLTCHLAACAFAAEPTKDTPEDVKKALAANTAVLIDVREKKEWDTGRLREASLLELSRLTTGVPQEEMNKKMPKGKIVYVYCKSGGRSLAAADLLAKKGYDVRSLKEGYEELLKAGLPKSE